MKRREFVTLLGGAAVFAPMVVRAQQAMPVIGHLRYGSDEGSSHLLDGFRRGLADEGFVEHRNVAIEYHWTGDRVDRLPELAAELVRRKVSVIVASPGASAMAAKTATADIPIVFGVGNDPIRSGLIASLNRPGGNATGVYFFTTELTAKRLGMLRELVPAARRVAVLVGRTAQATGLTKAPDIATKEAETAAAILGLTVEIIQASTSQEIDAAFAAMAKLRADVLVVSPGPLYTNRRVQLVTLAMRDRLPAIFPSRDFAEAGGLMSYGANIADEHRKMGIYAGRILKGTRPADLPVEQSTKFEFILNLQTARALGLEVPPSLSARADEVIE